MSLRVRYQSAVTAGIVLAKIGNPQRDEPLQTSREVFHIADGDQEILTELLLKPFRNLIGHHFRHPSSLAAHEMNSCAKAVFADPNTLLEKGCDIARRLYAKSTHPNIKSGDLCIALIRNIEVDGEKTEGLCILKSETVAPFLSISGADGDLKLTAEHGINPEKIDKGCLVLNWRPSDGHHVLTFDRAGAESRFWVRDFLQVVPLSEPAFLTNTYAAMAVNFLEEERPGTVERIEENRSAKHDAISYFEEKEEFNLQEFEREVLKTPEAVAKFSEHRARVEEDQGQPLEESFEISKKAVEKAKKKVGAVMKLDTGVEIHLKSPAVIRQDSVVEKGFDEARGMNFVKVFYNKDLA